MGDFQGPTVDVPEGIYYKKIMVILRSGSKIGSVIVLIAPVAASRIKFLLNTCDAVSLEISKLPIVELYDTDIIWYDIIPFIQYTSNDK